MPGVEENDWRVAGWDAHGLCFLEHGRGMADIRCGSQVAEDARTTGRMVDACRAQGLPEPEYEVNGGFVTIVFGRPARAVTVRGDSETVQKDTRNVPEEYQKQLAQKLSPIQKDIVAYLSYNPTAGRRELSERIDGLTEAKAQYHLRKLQRDGAIKRIGADRGGYWEILVTIGTDLIQ